MSTKISIPGVGHILAGGLREFGSHTELAPTSPFPNSEFESSDLSLWAISNPTGGNIDANTTKKSNLYLTSLANGKAPFIYNNLAGDFDVYTRLSGGPSNYGAQLLMAQSPSNPTIGVAVGSNSGNPFIETLNPLTITTLPKASGQLDYGGPTFLRLARSGSVFSGYVSWDGATWLLIDNPTSFADATANVGVQILSSANATLACDFMRAWPPYATSGPVSSILLGPLPPGTRWDTSTFQPYENPTYEIDYCNQIGFGSLSYQIGASDDASPTLNGTYLSAADIARLGVLTGSYLALKVRYTSLFGYDNCRFAGGTIEAFAGITTRITTPQPPITNASNPSTDADLIVATLSGGVLYNGDSSQSFNVSLDENDIISLVGTSVAFGDAYVAVTALLNALGLSITASPVGSGRQITATWARFSASGVLNGSFFTAGGTVNQYPTTIIGNTTALRSFFSSLEPMLATIAGVPVTLGTYTPSGPPIQ